MKKSTLFFAVLMTGLFNLPAFSQTDNEPTALGLPGDNLNLYAVLDIFQKSKTLEDFEKTLNEQDSKVNNLDLNNDGDIDYIEIESQKNGNIHSIVLQVAVSSTEKQDVAVIEVDKDKKNNIHVQIIGDEDLYGKNYIVEPSDNVSVTPNPGYKGDATVIVNNTTNNYNTANDNPGYVSAWPVVVFLYSPVYVVYRSPWYWGYYPSYWRPWRPVYYQDYWGYHGHYYNNNNNYRRTVVIRNPRYYNNYSTRRNTSVVVRDNRTNGRYNNTYNGRDYKRPAPVTSTRPTRPVTRPTNPSTRPGTTNPGATRPVTRPTNPSTKPGTTRPTTRPVTPTNPSTRPTQPVTRPTNPSTRPAVQPTQPVTRPTNPSTRPAVQPTRPTSPAVRPAQPQTTRPASQNRNTTTPRSSGNGSEGRR